MADIFVGYHNKDRSKVQDIVNLLRAEGWTVFWDQRIEAGELWKLRIRRELRDAGCILIVWSNRSIDPEAGKWVQAEADYAFDKNRLVGLRVEQVGIPVPYGSVQHIDFFDSGTLKKSTLVKAVRSKIDERTKRGSRNKRQRKHWRMINLECQGSGKIFEIDMEVLRTKRSLRLGRHPDCDIVFPDSYPEISRKHAQIMLKKKRGPCISDIQSTHGTKLTNEASKEELEVRGRPVSLARAKRLMLGPYSFLVKPSY